MDPVTKEYKKDENGNTVITKLNETELQQLAVATKGVYVRLDDVDDAVKKIVDQIGTIEQTSLEDSAFKDYRNYFQWLLGFGLLLVIIEFFFPERKLATT